MHLLRILINCVLYFLQCLLLSFDQSCINVWSCAFCAPRDNALRVCLICFATTLFYVACVAALGPGHAHSPATLAALCVSMFLWNESTHFEMKRNWRPAVWSKLVHQSLQFLILRRKIIITSVIIIISRSCSFRISAPKIRWFPMTLNISVIQELCLQSSVYLCPQSVCCVSVISLRAFFIFKHTREQKISKPKIQTRSCEQWHYLFS